MRQSAAETVAIGSSSCGDDVDATRLGCPNLSRLPPSAALGRPLGCLRIAPGAGLSRMQLHQAHYVVFALCVVVIAAVVIGATIFLPDWSNAEVRRLIYRTLGAAGAICLAIWCLRLKVARTVEVYEGGLRFTYRRGGVGAHEQFSWDQVDVHSNRAVVRETLGADLRRLTLTFRLHDFPVAQKSHELSLIVKPNEWELARFLVNRLRCSVQG